MRAVDWASFMADYREGLRTLGAGNFVDLRTGELGEGEPPDARCVPFLDTPPDARPRPACWREAVRDHRLVFMAFGRAPADVRRRLEDTHFDVTADAPATDSVAELRSAVAAGRAAHREALRPAPGVADTLARWRELASLHALAAWWATLPVELEPPPFTGQALAWQDEMDQAQAAWRSALLERLERWLRENAPPVHDALAPGLSDAAIDAAEVRLGRPLSPGLRALYRWRNGSPERFDFFFNASFVGLERAERLRAMMLELRDRGELREWSPAWLPVFERAGGDLLCFDAASGHLVDFQHETPADSRPAFVDVESWLETHVGALERGLFAFDGETLECVDHPRAERLVRAFASPALARDA